MQMRWTIEKARITELKPLLQILIERELKSCRFANFTMYARVSPVFLPNRIVHVLIAKSTSQPLDFSSLTETCQTTDAKFSSSCGNWRDHKNQQKGKYFKSTPFASYRLFLVQNWATICFWKVQYIPVWIGGCLWVQRLVITILCATLAYKKQVIWIHSNDNKNLHGKIY